MTDGITEANRVRCEVCGNAADPGQCVRALVDGHEFFAHDTCAVYAFKFAAFEKSIDSALAALVAMGPEKASLVVALIRALS